MGGGQEFESCLREMGAVRVFRVCGVGRGVRTLFHFKSSLPVGFQFSSLGSSKQERSGSKVCCGWLEGQDFSSLLLGL